MGIEMTISEEIKQNLRSNFASAVEQAVHSLEAHRVAGKKFPEREDVWTFCTESNGMPSFHHSWDFAADYSSALENLDTPLIDALTQRLVTFIGGSECLSTLFIDVEGAPDDEEARHDRLEMSVRGLLEELVDRYASFFETHTFSDAQFNDVWKPRAEYFFSPTLKYQLLVPILFTRFAFDSVDIAPHVAVKRMDDETNLARAGLDSGGPLVNEFVVSCATHAFVVDDLAWSTSYPRHAYPIHEMLGCGGDTVEFPTDLVNKCFAALRIVTGVETGYAQVLAKPVGWANVAYGKTMPLYGYNTPQYPPHFNQGYWLRPDLPHVTSDDATRIASVVTALTANSSRSLALAVGRLNLCSTRASEDDMLLDAAIGLEAALTGDSGTEITHKLAIRLGALSLLCGKCAIDAHEVFKNVKGLYRERSKIAHGASNEGRYSNLQTPSGEEKPAPMAAREYLRFAIMLLCEHPQYLDSQLIDKDMLLGIIASHAKRPNNENPSDSA